MQYIDQYIFNRYAIPFNNVIVCWTYGKYLYFRQKIIFTFTRGVFLFFLNNYLFLNISDILYNNSWALKNKNTIYFKLFSIISMKCMLPSLKLWLFSFRNDCIEDYSVRMINERYPSSCSHLYSSNFTEDVKKTYMYGNFANRSCFWICVNSIFYCVNIFSVQFSRII